MKGRFGMIQILGLATSRAEKDLRGKNPHFHFTSTRVYNPISNAVATEHENKSPHIQIERGMPVASDFVALGLEVGALELESVVPTLFVVEAEIELFFVITLILGLTIGVLTANAVTPKAGVVVVDLLVAIGAFVSTTGLGTGAAETPPASRYQFAFESPMHSPTVTAV